ncbi:MAG: serpin family protein [Clostridia bacterium]|nr:serpin family protein [Clostridia bacterium]
MSKKNFMKAMGLVSDSALNRYAKFERNLEKEKSNKKARLIRIAAIAACFAILIAAVPVSLMLRDDRGGELIIERDYFVMDGAAVKQLNSSEFKPTRIAGKVSDEFKDAAADFAFELLKESNKAGYEGDSLLVSPLSVMLALSMTANGAEGETLKQFEKVLGGKMDIDSLNAQLFNYTSTLTSTEKAKFNLANAVWLTSDPSFSVNRHFISRIENTFDADIVAADMTNPATVDEINSWVKKETFDMIDKIIDRGTLNKDSVMVLLNAIAFDAIWETEISDKGCFEDYFYGTDGKKAVTFMRTPGDRYLEGDNEIGFIKNYADGNYAFLALLPNEGIEIGDYVKSLTGEEFLEIYGDSYKNLCEVKAVMPHFTFDCNINMNDILKEMGIKEAFNPLKADLSGIGVSENGDLYIGQVLHKTHIELDNKGTKAAAVTGVFVYATCSAPTNVKYVTLDRPFVYAIIDTQTGLPVFLGVCENISGQK